MSIIFTIYKRQLFSKKRQTIKNNLSIVFRIQNNEKNEKNDRFSIPDYK
jgi:hypothetical protein